MDIGTDTADRGATSDGGPEHVRGTCRMTGDARSVRAARSIVQDLLAGQPQELRDVAILLTDELVTNALVHGGGRFSLLVQLDERALRVSVGDRSTAPPRVLQADGEREHGRGMAIVDTLATSWGTDQRPADKVVWFELAVGG